jgi:glycosyltransferase involved in cell wall biosynthesis
MRIFYDHQVFSLQDAGGASRYHYELIRNLQVCSDVEMELLIGLNNSVMPFASLEGDRTRVFGRTTRMKAGMGRYATNELLSSLVAPAHGKFDIYHPTLYRALPWVRRRRIVVTHHDCIHERFPQLFPNAASIMNTKRKLFRQAETIICVSESSRNDLLQFYDVDARKTHVVYHGFSPLPQASGGGKLELAPYLLYVGARAAYKNFSLLLDAFSRSGLASHYRLLAVGGGAWTTEERARIASLGLCGTVTLIPKAQEDVLSSAYQNAALFVYPSLYEGFGFPPLEAMSLGCPVLVNRTSSLPEVCGEAAFYLENSDPDEVARVLVSILNDGTGMAIKRRLGEQQVLLYDWGRTARNTLDVYRAVVTG